MEACGVARILTRSDRYQLIEATKRSRAKRKQLGVCFVEGVTAIDAAHRHGWSIRTLIHAVDARLSTWARGIVDRRGGAEIVELAPRLMAELSDRDETSELLAVVDVPAGHLDRIPRETPFIAVVLDRPSSPGNLGSILRSCDALGADGVVIRGHAADLWDPLTIRSSQGAVFSVPAVTDCSNRDLELWITGLRAALPGLQVVGASPQAPVRPWEVDFRRPTVLVLGNERRGISVWLRAGADSAVGIDTGGTVDSLNLAAAAAVLLYEVRRQRGSAAG